MMLLISFAISQLATFIIAMSMPKHYRQILTTHQQTSLVKITLVLVGWSMIILAIFVLALQQSISLALTEYFGVVTLNIILTALFFDSYARKRATSKNNAYSRNRNTVQNQSISAKY